MTRIGNSPPPNPSAARSDTSERLQADAAAKQLQGDAPQKKVLEKTSALGETTPDKAARKRSAHTIGVATPKSHSADLFQQKVLLAQKKSKDADRSPEDGKTLLVVLHPGDHKAAPAAQSVAHAPANAVASGTSRVQWFENLHMRIDQALLSVPRTPNGKFTLALQLAPHGTEGLRGVEISISPMALDVVLSRNEGQATVEYLAATQALAERLQDRFPKRVIRIHEVVSGSATSRKQDVEALSQTDQSREGSS